MLVGLGGLPQGCHLGHLTVVFQGRRKRLQEHLHQLRVLRLEDRRRPGHQQQDAEATIMQLQRAGQHVGIERPRQDRRGQRCGQTGVPLHHFSRSTPGENCLHLPRRAFAAALVGPVGRHRPSGHGLHPIPLRLNPPNQDAGDGDMRGQKAGNGTCRAADFDMPAGLAPDIQEQFAILVHTGQKAFAHGGGCIGAVASSR